MQSSTYDSEKKKLRGKILPYDEHIRYILVSLSHLRWQHLRYVYIGATGLSWSLLIIVASDTCVCALLRCVHPIILIWWCDLIWIFEINWNLWNILVYIRVANSCLQWVGGIADLTSVTQRWSWGSVYRYVICLPAFMVSLWSSILHLEFINIKSKLFLFIFYFIF